MSNLVFPTLPGCSIEVKRAPYWESNIQTSVSGRSIGLTAMTYPKWKYKLSYEFLRAGAQAELQQIVAFFNTHRGRTDTWLFFDEDDYQVTDQQIGLGDGSTTSFQLLHSFGSYIEPIFNVKQFDSVKVGGVATGAYSDAGGGRILFSAAPAAGQPITWSGQFYRRCRFDADTLDTEKFLYRLWKLKTLEFTTEKG
jgi:uncharacterized protein (TIGR02217 family)